MIAMSPRARSKPVASAAASPTGRANRKTRTWPGSFSCSSSACSNALFELPADQIEELEASELLYLRKHRLVKLHEVVMALHHRHQDRNLRFARSGQRGLPHSRNSMRRFDT